MNSQKVCVVGAGVIGLSSAVCIQEQCPGVDVTIVADRFSPDTTTDVSGGYWLPYCLGDTPVDKIRRWSQVTLDHLYHLYNSPSARATGCQLLSGYTVAKVERPDDDFKDQVFGYRHLTQKELNLFPNARWGVFYTGMQVDATLYLSWLMRRFKDRGGRVVKRKINSLEQITDQYDVIVNCTGLGAHGLVGDTSLSPVRGQLIRFTAPWLKHFIVDLGTGQEADTYILPGARNVVVGGTAQTGDWNSEVDEADTKDI